MNARTTVQDFAAMRQVFPTWNAPLASLPLHFIYGGRPYHGMPSHTHVTHELTDTNIFRAVYTAVLEEGLQIELIHTEYRDFPVREWVASFTNIGTADTPILENAVIGGELTGDFLSFVHGTGDNIRETGYDWISDSLADPPEISIHPVDGTSCNGASPFMKLCFGDSTLRIGIGWGGMWYAEACRTATGVRYFTGQKRCHTVIRPGETIRTPRLTVLAHTQGEEHGCNLWRRWYIRHILPRENGQPIRPCLCMHNFRAEGKPEFTAATEQNQLDALRQYLDGGIHPDVWWLDAGWYPCDNFEWYPVGTWEPDPVRFPKGLAPIGELCEKEGIRFLVWFEPERSCPGHTLHETHHDWLLTCSRDLEEGHWDNHLVDYENPEALAWVIEHIDAFIKKHHVHIYRQDLNFGGLLPYWEDNEAPDRIGAMENLHIQGHLRFLDELLLRNPGLWIDMCAGGGRRNDLDTMRRAVPLHYTDVGYGKHPVKQKQYRTMFTWIPYFRSHNMSWDKPDGSYGGVSNPVDEFAYQCTMTPAITSMTSYQDTERFAVDRKMAPIWREAAALMLSGDYFPLTECRMDAHDWYAMQFDDSDTGTGFVHVLRNVLVEEDTFTAWIHTEPGRTYTFTDRLTGNSFTKTADELEAGLAVTLPHRSGVVLFYTYR